VRRFISERIGVKECHKNLLKKIINPDDRKKIQIEEAIKRNFANFDIKYLDTNIEEIIGCKNKMKLQK
jgi:retron-type reverse transcriptase